MFSYVILSPSLRCSGYFLAFSQAPHVFSWTYSSLNKGCSMISSACLLICSASLRDDVSYFWLDFVPLLTVDYLFFWAFRTSQGLVLVSSFLYLDVINWSYWPNLLSHVYVLPLYWKFQSWHTPYHPRQTAPKTRE